MKRAAAIACLLLAGCATGGTGWKWYAPATWRSHRPADVADRAEVKEDKAKQAAIKAAQRATHETQYALASAPASRPVAVAVQSNDSAVVLLDQAAGPLTAEEAQKLRTTVAGLLSENADIRAAAERDRAREQRVVADLSADLAKAQTARDTANAKLREAFDRENALANQLRAQRALAWILAALAVVLAVGWVYVRFALGGLPVAAGRLMRDLRASHPSAAAVVTPLFDSYLNRHEQDRIARYAK